MQGNVYKTIDDVRIIITAEVSEGVSLEYKGSRVAMDQDINATCKAITALANSAGGHFLIGIESKGGRPIRLDGGVQGNSISDWLHKIINANTHPPVESVEIIELSEPSGRYYIIAVPASRHAPHQNNDKRYYKRRGSHSEPMEHYEIEDVRSRPKQKIAPLRVELLSKDGIAFLHLKNEHDSLSVTNVCCSIRSNVEFQRDAIQSLGSRGLRQMNAQIERSFLLDGIGVMLEKNPEAELEVTVKYQFQGLAMQETTVFYLADFSDSVIMRSPTVEALGSIVGALERLSRHTEKLERATESLARIADGTGLRLSQRTLTALKDRDQLLDPYEFNWDGYKIILDISASEAISLHQIFGTMLRPDRRKERYDVLPAELRQKFEKHFKLDFGA